MRRPSRRPTLMIRSHGTRGSSCARKASLRHGPGLLSLVADRHAPGSAVAGQRPRRPRRHRQPRALGLGGAGRHAAGGEPDGRPRGAVERQPAAISRYRRLRQPRIRQPGRDLSHPRRARQIRHQADPGARQGRRRPLPVPGQGGPEARRRVHRARSVAPAHHPYRHVRGRGAAIHPRLDRGGRKGHRQAPDRLVRPRFPGDAEHPQPARRGGHPLRLRLGQ